MGCISCRRCCIWGHAVLSAHDVSKISSHLGLETERFIDQFTDKNIWDGFSQIVLISDVNKAGCVFLSDAGCEIYAVRPDACAAFPRADHIDKELINICERAKEMCVNTALNLASDVFRDSAFRFFDGGGYGINYKNNSYFFLDEIGARLVREVIYKGVVDTESMAREYGVDEEVIINDAFDFFRQFSAVDGVAEGGEANLKDENFFEFFTDNKIPLTAIVEVTEACNEDCIHCYRPEPKKEYWTVDRFEKACAELASMGSLQLDFTGGEPFLKKNFIEFLKIADRYGFIVSILTNATLIGDDELDVLKAIKLRSIYVSVYSADAKVHDQITRLPGSFQKTVGAIRRLKSNGLPVFINSPIMDANRDSPEGIKSFADSLGVDVKFSYKITDSYENGKSTKELNIFSKEELSRMINNPNVRLYADIIDNRASGGAQARDRVRSCDTGFRSITISPEGDILPCTALRMKCGNVGVQAIASLWAENESMQYWRQEGCLVKEGCKTCSSYDFCEPCPAGYFATHGSLDGIDEITCGFGKAFSSCVLCK